MNIPDDILAIAGVVTGDDRTTLTGWQRRDAIAAMTALGYSGAHIAWVLRLTRTAAYKSATTMGVTLHRTDQRPDWTAIAMVVHGTARVRLTGVDRDEAVRQLASRYTCTEIADRLQCRPSDISCIARRLGITLHKDDPWDWYAYLTHHGQRQAVAA